MIKNSNLKTIIFQELNEISKLSFFHWIGFVVCCIALSDFIFEQKLDWQLLGVITVAFLVKTVCFIVRKMNSQDITSS